MEISELLKNQKVVKLVGDFGGLNVESLAFNTKNISQNCMFFCLRGTVNDGHNFAKTAKDCGAKVLVVERALEVDIPQIVVENTRSALSLMAGNFYGNPRNKLKVIGVTGTNGKTTTTYMIQSILKNAGYKVGVIGTIGVVIDDVKLPAHLTTPDPIELHSLFAQMVNKKVDYVVMEVSAHAIKLDKMFGTICDVGILTNITQDHLDFFKTFENYKQTKLDFISSKFVNQAVVNIDDEMVRNFVIENHKNPRSVNIFSYGLNNPCDTFAVEYKCSLKGTHYYLNLFDEVLEINTSLIGEFNLYNALASATACKILGIDTTSIKCGLENMEEVPGRFNVLNLGKDRFAVVDYAHTPDGLKNILTSVRQISNGKIISVFGCGGNRDSSKRCIMGKISGSLADFTIITSDNPRLEKPSEIIEQIESGVKEVSLNYLCVEDRKKAISFALSKLKKGDVAVISGKGAENYIDIGGVKYHYSDFETIEKEKQKLIKEQEFIC